MATTTGLREDLDSRGYVGPIRVFPSDEIATIRRKFYETAGVDEANPQKSEVSTSLWHWFEPWMADLVRDERLLDVVSDLLGPDLIVWNTHFWYKPPEGQKPVPWHQDGMYWSITPREGVTAWIAVSDTTVENGCIRVVPSADRPFIDHQEIEAGVVRHLNNELPKGSFDESAAIDLEMRAGEILFFDQSLVHCSRPNVTGSQARVALSIRYVPPHVRFDMERWAVSPERVRLQLVRGEDTHHLNDELYAPPAGMTSARDRRP
jgi:ectoine hydroxylase-related dioxygenase (phytanoyl-CoA dioxygenase family)